MCVCARLCAVRAQCARVYTVFVHQCLCSRVSVFVSASAHVYMCSCMLSVRVCRLYHVRVCSVFVGRSIGCQWTEADL
jgi:hypothetical protein